MVQEAINITEKGFIEAIKLSSKFKYEFQIQGIMEKEFRMSGSKRNGYPSIVASGKNACILHYIENNQKFEEGSLLLIDAGSEWDYYSADVTRTIGGLAFNRLRLFFVSIMLIAYTFYINTWNTISIDHLTIIIVSGIVGIFLGDTLLFIALQKIGPRRNNILFSLAAPFTVVINIFFLNELASTISIIGCFVVFFGVVYLKELL